MLIVTQIQFKMVKPSFWIALFSISWKHYLGFSFDFHDLTTFEECQADSFCKYSLTALSRIFSWSKSTRISKKYCNPCLFFVWVKVQYTWQNSGMPTYWECVDYECFHDDVSRGYGNEVFGQRGKELPSKCSVTSPLAWICNREKARRELNISLSLEEMSTLISTPGHQNLESLTLDWGIYNNVGWCLPAISKFLVLRHKFLL